MNADMRMTTNANGNVDINLSLPPKKAVAVFEAIKKILPLAGIKPRWINEDGEELIPASEVFPEGSPAMALRGLRGKEDITQEELAQRLGISQNVVSDMESGRRNISLKMAKRIAEEFKVPYKAFL